MEGLKAFQCQGDACEKMPMNSAEFMGIFPAAALCDQSADWTLARQEEFFPRRMSLEKIFEMGGRGTGQFPLYGSFHPALQRDGSLVPPAVVQKNRPSSPAFYGGLETAYRGPTQS